MAEPDQKKSTTYHYSHESAIPKLVTSTEWFMKKYYYYLQAYLRNVAGLVPDHCNTANIAIKPVT